ncbi:MAG: TetR/AcrR family transcriptional regulator [Deltaproteobacteria bacterium]|nr:TetR/AcrR family transcriptional regulator [Deltaproteobacteria bacterium]
MEWAKRECILVAATKAFSKLGFKKASVDDIAKEAGVAKGTVYLACESKEDLFYQAVHRELRAWIAQIAQMVDPRVGADELLRQVAAAGFAYLEQHPLVRDLFLGILHGQLPGWAHRFDQLRALGQQNIVEILKLGIAQKRFRHDLDVEETAMILQDMTLAGYLFQNREGQTSRAHRERRLKAGLDLVLHGLQAAESSS